MANLVIRIAYFFFLALASLMLLILIFSSVVYLKTTIESKHLENKNIKISYSEIEKRIKSQGKDGQNQHSVSDQQTRVRRSEVKSEVDKLIDDIIMALTNRNVPIEETKLRTFLNSQIARYDRQDTKIQFLKGFKSVSELAPINELPNYIDTYIQIFDDEYSQLESRIQELEETKKYAIWTALSAFSIIVALSIVMVLFVIERNTRAMLDVLKHGS